MRISVVIPLYNKAATVQRALQSVLAQTVEPIEIIVVNDGSTDASAEVVSRLNIPGVKLIHQNNAGVSAARNRGIQEARGEWIAFLDADDEWMPDYLASIVALHSAYPGCMVYATSYLLRDDNAEIMSKIRFKGESGIINNYFKMASSGSPPLWTGAVVASKAVLIGLGGFCEQITIGEDLLLWAQLAYRYDVAFLNKPKSIYYFPLRINSKSSIRLPDDGSLVYDELMSMYTEGLGYKNRKYLKKYIGSWCKMRLYIYSFYQNKYMALLEYRKCFRMMPFNYKTIILLILALLPFKIHDYLFDLPMKKMI